MGCERAYKTKKVVLDVIRRKRTTFLGPSGPVRPILLNESYKWHAGKALPKKLLA